MPDLQYAFQYSKKKVFKQVLWAGNVSKILLKPLAFVFMLVGRFLNIFVEKKIKITKKIIALLDLIPLTIQVYFWSLECFLSYYCRLRNPNETAEIIKKKIYQNLDIILWTFGILPLTEHEKSVVFAFLDKFRKKDNDAETRLAKYKIYLFGDILLPWPLFLFEDPVSPQTLPALDSPSKPETDVQN